MTWIVNKCKDDESSSLSLGVSESMGVGVCVGGGMGACPHPRVGVSVT